MICKTCGKDFVVRKIGQTFCGRACSNAGRDSRRSPQLNRPCDCGSGLPARRTTVPDSAGFRVGCDACKVQIQARDPATIRKFLGDEQDRRNAEARRRLEAMRDERELRL